MQTTKNAPNARSLSENTPNAAKLIDSLRFLGYNNYSAICDIIDNSLDAEATKIWVYIRQEDGLHVISIVDNGIGMNRDTLDQALRLGSMTHRDQTADLGKFGMGLVTASLSIALTTSVMTRCNGKVLKSVTDVAEIKARNAFVKYLGTADAEDTAKFDVALKGHTGTLVELRNCDGLKNKQVGSFAKVLQSRVAQVYRYYLQAGKEIYVNGSLVTARDPLMLNEKGTETFSDEIFDFNFDSEDGKTQTEKVRVRLVVLPDFGDDGNKQRGIGQDAQGFYILRNNREIESAQHLGLFKRHNDLNRMRGEIFFSATLDEHMGVNFTKQGVSPSQPLSDKLREVVAGQIKTIRTRLTTARKAEEHSDISHEESEKAISAKSHLLARPKTSTKTPPTPPDGESPSQHRTRKDQTNEPTSTPKQTGPNVKFSAANLGRNGPIYEADQQGRVICIQWNIDHPFYERFILERKSDKTLRTSVDFLVYSMATAELITADDDDKSFELIQSFKVLMSNNLRSLLA